MIEEEKYRDYKADHERRIAKAFSELSVSQRELLKTLYEDGMSKQEYADAIGVSPSAISHQLETIKKKIKKILR
ncbi:DNA-binding helix-turn-helix protein [Eubacterium nodatum ATCC 33099]|nr:DNA-binding helix-turn-helix protein [Eubacterium nodatum ATCC 33099]